MRTVRTIAELREALEPFRAGSTVGLVPTMGAFHEGHLALFRDLDLEVEIRVLPTVRDADGLALSSRNAYLSAEEHERALALPRALRARDRELLDGLEVDYFDEADFEPRVLAAAVRVGS